jgi:hypothetical protein
MSKPLNPAVPKGRITIGTIIFGIIGTTIVGAYAAVAITQWEPTSAERDELPASVRSSPGGYRSYHFWHVGYHGGK